MSDKWHFATAVVQLIIAVMTLWQSSRSRKRAKEAAETSGRIEMHLRNGDTGKPVQTERKGLNGSPHVE